MTIDLTDFVGGSSGSGVNALFKTANYTAVSGDIVGVGTDTAAVAITLPATPVADAFVVVFDADDNAQVNNITIGRNGSTIDGVASDFVINVNGGRVDLIYSGSTWKVGYSTPGASGFTGKTRVWFDAYVDLVAGAAGTKTTLNLASSGAYQGVFQFPNSGFPAVSKLWKPPKRWNALTIRHRFIFSPSSTNVGVVVLSAEHGALGHGDSFTNFSSTSTINVTTSGVTNQIQYSDWSSLYTITNQQKEDMLYLEWYRQGDHASDTFTGTVQLFGIELEYTTDAPTDD